MIPGDEDVFRLDVSVKVALIVDVLNTITKLHKYIHLLILRKIYFQLFSKVPNHVFQSTILAVFHDDHVQVVFCFDWYVEDFNDVFMALKIYKTLSLKIIITLFNLFCKYFCHKFLRSILMMSATLSFFDILILYTVFGIQRNQEALCEASPTQLPLFCKVVLIKVVGLGNA